ncbi:MAG: FKBP-type peptidyl-prolyl cis-trans isomerase [Gammaproteobacteria bacterium]|nr:FKBP-type peptidyl-prolyl cis-trans isomerase [Gammaproteobacteria bacterium]MBQ0838314.1 FKBP-type peptidyl-prolyl cis-trans isomerase [Gammaproteobacteria bacterium]
MSSEQVIDDGLISRASRVTLHFSLSLEDGSVIDSNFDQSPATLSIGDGNLPLGFEEHLLGLQVGQQASFSVLPEKAFGQHNPSNIQRVKRDSFAADMALSEGLVVSFADANKGELPGVIQTIGEDEVTVDFNHPLAGKTLTFKVEIVAVDNTITELA